MIVKICGIRSLEDAILARDCGADWLGFIFAPSRRQVSPQLVKEISAKLTGCLKIGVFLDAPLDEVRETVNYCKLDLVQLHGSEDKTYRTRLALPHIKVFSLRPDGQAADAAQVAANLHDERYLAHPRLIVALAIRRLVLLGGEAVGDAEGP